MRIHYMSDLHLEAQGFRGRMPEGDVLVIAGDLCHADCFEADAADGYKIKQRERVMRMIDAALKNFAHVLLVAGNHEHYGSIFDETVPKLRRALPGVTVLDNETIEIGQVRFFGTTLWSDYDDRSVACMDAVRKRCGEFFFVKMRAQDQAGQETLRKFRPEDALAALDTALENLRGCLAQAKGRPTVIITHHAPSLKGLNPHYAVDAMSGTYASDLDAMIQGLENVPAWIHGHTHIRRVYKIGGVQIRTDARGFDGRDLVARSFTGQSFFEI
ncbi:metallophosphoesterase [Bradyrhizobium sp. LTSP885]|uniref:metallophosphoesterase n=1 Tax=Bradyrhizobium sp. LTSP885 TaxID=1619232 RepID=UPI0009E32D5B|nr:metallophosphoesterase [Bradyrhizobium sp. LTSP885]